MSSLVEIGPVVLEKILNDPPQFCNYIPFEGDLALYLNNFEFPLPNDDFQPRLVEIDLLVLEKILKIFSVFLFFCYYLPLVIGVALNKKKIEPPSPTDDFRQLWLKLAKCVWRRSRKCKCLTDRRTTGDQKSSFELSF